MHAEKIHTKQDLLEVLFQHGATIKSYGVSSLGLFGSFINGTYTEESDIDILYSFEEAIGLFKLIGIKDDLEQKLNKKVF